MSVQKVVNASSKAPKLVPYQPKEILNKREVYDKGQTQQVIKTGRDSEGKIVALTRIGNQLYLIDMQHNMLYNSGNRKRIESHSQQLNIKWQ